MEITDDQLIKLATEAYKAGYMDAIKDFEAEMLKGLASEAYTDWTDGKDADGKYGWSE